MGKYSLINVSNRNNGCVSGKWLQDFTGSLNEAFAKARSTEAVNSNRIVVAVVEKINSMSPDFSYKEFLSEKTN